VETHAQKVEGGDFACQEVGALSYDISSGLLVVAHRYTTIHLYQLNDFKPVFIRKWAIDDHTPTAVFFGQLSAGGPEIWSFGRDDGMV
jgi:hypothetical protein